MTVVGSAVRREDCGVTEKVETAKIHDISFDVFFFFFAFLNLKKNDIIVFVH